MSLEWFVVLGRKRVFVVVDLLLLLFFCSPVSTLKFHHYVCVYVCVCAGSLTSCVG